MDKLPLIDFIKNNIPNVPIDEMSLFVNADQFQ